MGDVAKVRLGGGGGSSINTYQFLVQTQFGVCGGRLELHRFMGCGLDGVSNGGLGLAVIKQGKYG